MSFVERSIILCPYLGGSTIGGSTVFIVEQSVFEKRGNLDQNIIFELIKCH